MNRTSRAGVVAAVAAVGLVVATSPALAANSSASATISAGTLSMTQPTTTGFGAVTLNGTDQTTTAAQAFTISDATGSGNGWNLTATSTTFTNAGSKTLSTAAATIQSAPSNACSGGVTCTTATTSGITYPYTLPAGASAPTATKMFNASANTGMGNQSVSATFTLAVPANAFAGTYTSTWTYSLVSAP